MSNLPTLPQLNTSNTEYDIRGKYFICLCIILFVGKIHGFYLTCFSFRFYVGIISMKRDANSCALIEVEGKPVKMNIQKLRELYNNQAVVAELCDEMALRERKQWETKLSRMLALLENKGSSAQKSEVIAAFRSLEECGCGQYVVGRHKKPSRFVWSVSSLDTCQAAQGKSNSVEPLPETDDDIETDAELDSVTHCLRLRSDFNLELQLPDDLTHIEAERLCSFISALPLSE